MVWGSSCLRKGVHLQVSPGPPHLPVLWLSVLNCKLFFLVSFSIFLVSVKRFSKCWDCVPAGRSTPSPGPAKAAHARLGSCWHLWSLLASNLPRFTFFCDTFLQKPTLGREGPVASLLHCRRATLAFQSIYYEIKWIPLGLIPCCNYNEKKQFLTLHLRSITIKIH